MGKFYTYQGNKLISVGECPDGQEIFQATDGVQVGKGLPPSHLVPDSHVPPPPPEVLRRKEYPTVGDQLDALWKALEPVIGNHQEAKKILNRIRDTKLKYPKEKQ